MVTYDVLQIKSGVCNRKMSSTRQNLIFIPQVTQKGCDGNEYHRSPRHARDTDPIMGYRWPNVEHAGPALPRYRFNVSCA